MQLSNVSLSGNLRVGRSANAFVSYDGRRNYRYYQNRLVPEEVFDDLLHQGLRAGLNFARRGGFGATASVGMSLKEKDPRHPELDLANAYSANAGVRHGDLLGGFSVGLDASGFSNGYTDGALVSARLGRHFAAGHMLDLSYGRSLYRVQLDEQDRVTQWLRLVGRVELPGRLLRRERSRVRHRATISRGRACSSSSGRSSEAVMTAEQLTWGTSLAVVAAIVAPYLLAFRRRRHSDRARREEAVQLGIHRPMAQFPFVDPMACIGCGSCVEACPEGDVLGVIGGTAVVVNGLRCVGHARCEIACPVGAIKVGLGDVKSREDVPLMDEWQETSVPGMFVAGELTGMALVKNAVAHGRKVVDRIAQRAARARAEGKGEAYDVAIVGAGPAGLTAAALARERGLSAVVLEQEPDLGGTILHYPRRKLVLVQALEIPFLGPLKEGEYEKEELLETFLELTRQARLNIRFGSKVTGVTRPNGHFAVPHVLVRDPGPARDPGPRPPRHAAQARSPGRGPGQGPLPAGRCRQPTRTRRSSWWAAATAPSRPSSAWPTSPATR